MSTQTTTQLLEKTLLDAIQSSIDHEKEKIIREALDEFERRVRKVVGMCAVQLHNYYSVERLGTELVIHVRIDGSGETRRV